MLIGISHQHVLSYDASQCRRKLALLSGGGSGKNRDDVRAEEDYEGVILIYSLLHKSLQKGDIFLHKPGIFLNPSII